MSAASSHRWFMSRVFGRKRPSLRVERLPLTEAIVEVARSGGGIAVLSEWIAGAYLSDGRLVARRLGSGPLRRPWRLAWRREVTSAALRLHGLLGLAAPQLSWAERVGPGDSSPSSAKAARS